MAQSCQIKLGSDAPTPDTHAAAAKKEKSRSGHSWLKQLTTTLRPCVDHRGLDLIGPS